MSDKIIHTNFPNNIGVPNTLANAMQNYTQKFIYNNQLLGHTNGNNEYTYDIHGNMLSMPHLNSMLWDYKDELKEVVLNEWSVSIVELLSTSCFVSKQNEDSNCFNLQTHTCNSIRRCVFVQYNVKI